MAESLHPQARVNPGRDPLNRFQSFGALSSAVLLIPVLTCLLLPASASAQLLHLDPMPWFAPADSTSRLALVLDLDYFVDPKYDWSANRILVTAVLPAGKRAAFFVRMPHVTFDTGNVPVLSRWPWIRGEEADYGWPYQKRIVSFGQPEIGATGPTGLPLMDKWRYAVAVGLPAGTDKLYPFSSVSLPWRLQLRRDFGLGARTVAGVTLGYLMNIGSSRTALDDDAFPNGFHLGANFDWYRRRGSRFALAWDYQDRNGRRSQLVGVQAWFPWTESGSMGLKVSRELQGSLDRPAAWYFTVSWRFDSSRYRPGVVEDETAPLP